MRWKVILKTIKNSGYPSKEACIALLIEYGTPKGVIAHCRKVAQVAEAVALELNRCGLKLNISLVVAAGCLHDIARVHSKHDIVGADYLTSIGMKQVADIIENHTFYHIEHKGFQIDEKDVLCIADRVVIDDSYVGPEKRMEYIIEKAVKKFGEEKRRDLEKTAANFVEYIRELESFMGKKFVDFLVQ